MICVILEAPTVGVLRQACCAHLGGFRKSATNGASAIPSTKKGLLVYAHRVRVLLDYTKAFKCSVWYFVSHIRALGFWRPTSEWLFVESQPSPSGTATMFQKCHQVLQDGPEDCIPVPVTKGLSSGSVWEALFCWEQGQDMSLHLAVASHKHQGSRTYTIIRVCVQICKHARDTTNTVHTIYTHVCAYVYRYTHNLHLQLHPYEYAYMYTCAYMCTYTHVYIQLYIYIYTYVYTHPDM